MTETVFYFNKNLEGFFAELDGFSRKEITEICLREGRPELFERPPVILGVANYIEYDKNDLGMTRYNFAARNYGKIHCLD